MDEKDNCCLHLVSAFAALPDPRDADRAKYPLIEIVFLTVVATISGAVEWEEIVDFGDEKLSWLRKYLKYENGIPSHDTINRVIGMIEYRSFEECFLRWANMGIVLPHGVEINIDGKKLRSSATKKEQQTAHVKGGKSAVHLVEAWCSAFQMCLAQYKVADKSNEITAIPVILDWLELSGCIVTIDAMGCQRSIAGKVRSKGADYVLALKENQEGLYLAVTAAFDNLGSQLEASRIDEQAEIGHGRREKRKCRTIPARELPDWALAENWEGMKQVVEVEAERTVVASGESGTEKRYYITSLDCPASRMNQLVRGHWSIENQLHWSMDVQFGEDASRKRSRNSAANFALIRRIGLNLLKSYPEKISIGRKITKCAISDDYRGKIIEAAKLREIEKAEPNTC